MDKFVAIMKSIGKVLWTILKGIFKTLWWILKILGWILRIFVWWPIKIVLGILNCFSANAGNWDWRNGSK